MSRVLSSATVKKIKSISPTVKYLKLHVENKELDFKPGQWVDFFIPGISTVGGFSMCSTPTLLRNEQVMDLAVKYSTHPPAHWVHNNCTEGSSVSLQVGGKFTYEMRKPNIGDNLLLIAAGVGINPILSIMKHIHEVHYADRNSVASFGKILLFYTATTCDELIFKHDITAIESKDSLFKTHLFVTREPPGSLLHSDVYQRRMTRDDLESGLELLGVPASEVVSYMCAPEPMMSEMDDILTSMGLLKENIRYESWW